MKYFIPLLFLVFGITLAHAQTDTLIWARATSGPRNEATKSIALDNNGNVYTAGIFSDTIDANPGAGVLTLNSSGNQDIFIQKFDSSGTLIWAKQIGGKLNDEASSIAVDNFGDVYVTGFFADTVDFDPNTGVNKVGTKGGDDLFILKLSSTGNFTWVRTFGSRTADKGLAITCDKDNNVYATGYFQETIDFNPGTGVTLLSADNLGDVFVVKFDKDGNFLLAKQFEGGTFNLAYGIAVDQDYGIYLTGYFKETIDIAPGAATTLLNSKGDQDIFVVKLDALGNYSWGSNLGTEFNDIGRAIAVNAAKEVVITGTMTDTNQVINGKRDVFVAKFSATGAQQWLRTLKGNSANVAYAIKIDNNDFISVLGSFTGIIDLDPEIGTTNTSSVNKNDIFLVKLTSGGSYVNSARFGNVGDDEGYALAIDAAGNTHFAGSFQGTVDFDPSTKTFPLTTDALLDAFVGKIRRTPCSEFSARISLASDISCSTNGSATATGVRGLVPYTYSWNTMPTSTAANINVSAAGLYQVTVRDAMQCQKELSVLINAPLVTNRYDLSANIILNSNFRKGFNNSVTLDVFNDGCVSQGGTVTIFFDSALVSYVNANIAPNNFVRDTAISWNFPTTNFSLAHFLRDITFKAKGNLGDLVCLNVVVSPSANDSIPSNNNKQYCFNISNAFDPNDKAVYPKGECEPGYILQDQLLSYTIRFQNTGNAPAQDVYVLDTLSDYLDLQSIRVLYSSHPMITELVEGSRVLKFRFDNINLPDSSSNLAASSGYFVFSAMPIPNLVIGTRIENKVGIYFDFNEAVITNNVHNTIAENIDPINTTINASICKGDTYSLGNSSYQNAGTYTKKFVTIDGCDSTVTLNLSQIELDNAITQFGHVLSANLENASYQWVDCNAGSSPIAGENAREFTAKRNGNYAVIINKDNCTTTSPCYAVNSLGISTKSSNALLVSPNPSTGKIKVALASSNFNNATIQVIDLLGKTVLELNGLNKANVDIDLSHLKSGIYFITLQQNQLKQTIKLVKN